MNDAKTEAGSRLETDLDKLRFYRAEIKHEFDHLSGRVSAFITSQSFLCLAYASSMGNLNPRWSGLFTFVFPVTLALLGVVTAFLAGRGIGAACETITLWHIKQRDVFIREPALLDYRIERSPKPLHITDPVDAVHRRSLEFARWSPRLFAAAWVVFGGLAVWLHRG